LQLNIMTQKLEWTQILSQHTTYRHLLTYHVSSKWDKQVSLDIIPYTCLYHYSIWSGLDLENVFSNAHSHVNRQTIDVCIADKQMTRQHNGSVMDSHNGSVMYSLLAEA